MSNNNPKSVPIEYDVASLCRLLQAQSQSEGLATGTLGPFAVELSGSDEQLKLVLRRALQLDYGLSPEEEFRALSTWMGQCALIHPLDQKRHRNEAGEEYAIPDYLAFYRVNDQLYPVLVEVKSVKGRESVSMTGKYYDRLLRYADTVHLPILVACKWKDFGWWTLFDLGCMPSVVKSHRISVFESFQHDLMGVLLGSVMVSIPGNTRIVIEVAVEHYNSDSEFVGRIRAFDLVNPSGMQVKFPKHFLLLLTQCEDSVISTESEGIFRQEFRTTQDWSTMSYKALHVARELAHQMDTRWPTFADNGYLGITYADLRAGLDDGLEAGVVQYVMRMIPAKLPPWLPAEEIHKLKP